MVAVSAKPTQQDDSSANSVPAGVPCSTEEGDEEAHRGGAPYTVRNHILNQMTPEEFDLLRPSLQLVRFGRGFLIQQVDAPVEFVFFIEKGIVSLLARSATDLPVEIATVHRLGMVGIEVIVDASRAIHRALVQTPAAETLRISIKDLRAATERKPSIRRYFAQFSQSQMRQSAQNLLCNTKHPLEQRLAKWLLLASEQFEEPQLPITHEALAIAMGVRRPSVTNALADFESRRIIVKSRGAIQLKDLDALRASACSCLVPLGRLQNPTPANGAAHRLSLK